MKFAAACAFVFAAASAMEAQNVYEGLNHQLKAFGKGAKTLGGQTFSDPDFCYDCQFKVGAHNYESHLFGPGDCSYKCLDKVEGFCQYGHMNFGRVSPVRPLDVKAYNAEPVDPFYYKADDKADQTIKASCTFDFLGFSMSSGQIELSQKPGDLVEMTGEFDRIKPGHHGLKVHEFGDIEYGCNSVGAVFNPFQIQHGKVEYDIDARRVGDINQVMGRWDTTGEYKIRDHLLMLSGPNSVLGRSMVLYERKDDFFMNENPPTVEKEERKREGQGPPIACCVIGLAQGEGKKEPVPAPKPEVFKSQPLSYAAPGYRAGPRNYGYGGNYGYGLGQHGHGFGAYAAA